MKPKSFLIATAFLTASSMLQAAPFTWSQTSAATQDWTAAGNWVASTPFVSDPQNELVFFANVTTNLANGTNAITTNVPATLSMNTLTLNGRANTASGSTSTVDIATNASTWTIGDGIISTVNLNGLNNLSNGTPWSGLYLNYKIAANLTLNQASTLFTGAGNGGFLISGNMGEAASGHVIIKEGTSILSLSGTNNYTGGSNVNGGGLIFRNLASKPSAGTHAFAANTTLGLGVLGLSVSGFFTATDIDNAFANNMTGNLAGITRDAATNIGIDTTDGDFTYATSIGGGPTNGLVKLGAHTLTLTGANTFTGPATILQGTLSVDTLANGGLPSNIGAAAAGAGGLVLNGGTLRYTGPTATTDRGFTHAGNTNSTIHVATDGAALAMGACTFVNNQAINFSGGVGSSLILGPVNALVTANQANFVPNLPTTLGPVTYAFNTGQFTMANRSTNGSTLTYGDITGPGSAFALFLGGQGTVNGVISGFTGSLILGAGGTTMTLLGANTFTGLVDIRQASTIAFNSIKDADGTPSALGAPLAPDIANPSSGTIIFGQTTNNQTLRYIGTGDTTNRVIRLAGTTGTVTLEQAGTGLLKFTSAFTATGAGSKTLGLSGSTAGTGEIAAAIVNNSLTNVTSVSKSGTGTWTLSGANTYTGTTSVNEGTLALVGGSQSSPITVTTTGTLGFTLGSPTVSTSSVTFASGSKVAITGAPASPADYLLMTASGGITGTPALGTSLPSGYVIETRNSGTELWLDFNPNIQTHVIDLGAGTAIAGGTFGTYAGPITGLPLPAFPVGTMLRSVAVSTTLTATDAENFASDFNLLFDPTPGTPGGDFILAVAASDATPPVFGTNNVLSWPASANGGVGTNLVDFKGEATWTGLVGAIDLSTTGLFLGNNFGAAPEGGTWSGTITLTYELPGGPYDTWAAEKGLTASNNAKNLDPDTDGRNNLAEFALDGNPLSGVNDGKVVGKITTVGGQQVLTLTLPVRTGAAFSNSGGDQLSAPIDGVTYRIEGDGNLNSFADTITEVTGGDASAIQAGLPAPSSGWTYRTFRGSGTVPTVPKAFLRARINEAP